MPSGYVDLGPRGPVTGTPDPPNGVNPGNWTVQFTPDILSFTLAQAEVYKIVVKGAPATTFDVYRENKLWDVGVYGTLNSWDPQQPLIMIPGQTLSFAYSDPVTDNNPPVITVWLRYDATLDKNKYGGQQ